MRMLVIVAVIALVGAIATTIVYFTATTVVAPLCLFLAFVAFTSGIAALMWQLSVAGVTSRD